jgi:peroxiredoxin
LERRFRVEVLVRRVRAAAFAFPPITDEAMRHNQTARRTPGLVAAMLLALAVGVGHAEVVPGDAAPEFTLPDVDGVSHSLSDYRGKVVLLDFIGYACPPCIDSAPDVEAIWQDFKGTGSFQAIALDCWNGVAFQVQGFIDQTGVTFPVLRNAGFLQSQEQYGIDFDNYVVVDADGIVRYTSVDEPASFNETAIRSTIEAYLPVAIQRDSWSAIKGLFR